jgi:hypothetical protein
MPDQTNPHSQPAARQYEIRVGGSLGDQWADWFEGLALTRTDQDETLLTGWVADQAALHGLLKKVRDLGLPLLSVNALEPGSADAAGKPPQKE